MRLFNLWKHTHRVVHELDLECIKGTVYLIVCPINYTFLGGRCYRVDTGELTWLEADALCTNEGAEISSLEEPEEFQMIRNWLTGENMRQQMTL